MLNFPGPSSKQMSHHFDMHLEDKSTDTTILHIAVNDLYMIIANLMFII